MVIRIQRVIGKSGHPIFPNGESSQPSMETDLHHWREYFTEIMMKREQHSEDEFKTQSGGRITPGDDAGTEWVTATSGGAQTATGKNMLAQISLLSPSNCIPLEIFPFRSIRAFHKVKAFHHWTPTITLYLHNFFVNSLSTLTPS